MQRVKRIHGATILTFALGVSILLPMGDNAAHATEAPVLWAEALSDGENLDANGQDAAMLAWMENELQMSIDPSGEPLGIYPDDTCLEPPYNCRRTERCPLKGGGQSLCFVTGCGTGACPTCPNIFSNLIITSWCSYSCMKGSDVVGSAVGFWFRGPKWAFLCLGG